GLSVLDNCMVGACFGHQNLPLARAHEVVLEVAQSVGLADQLKMMAGGLTTPSKKRLGLARALCSRPKHILLPELLAGLNPTEVERMIEIVRSVRQRGVTILMIEHVMRAIMSLSDRIVVLNLGAKLAEGTPHEVANNTAVIEAYLGDPKMLAQTQE